MGDNYKRSKCGIYKILNKINNKFYIGSGVKISRRWAKHRKDLRDNKHHSKYLQRSWNKYGETNFEFLIIEECSKETLIAREQYYIDTFKPEYNSSLTAGNCLGVKHSQESNFKKSENHFMKGKFGKDHISSREIFQYDLEGNFIKTWFGAGEIQRELGFNAGNLRKGIDSPTQTPYGYYWSYAFQGEKISPRQKRNRSKTCKPIGMFDLNDNLIKRFSSQKEAMEFLGIKTNSSINVILKNKHGHKTAYGYKWKYL